MIERDQRILNKMRDFFIGDRETRYCTIQKFYRESGEEGEESR
jgi:hypothetical protein